MLLIRNTASSRFLLLASLFGSCAQNIYARPVVIPLVPHHEQVQRVRRSLLQSASTTFPRAAERPVPLHARSLSPSSSPLQTAALFQGYGTHYADLWCGTPAQRQTVIVDTGSGVTAFPCTGCRDCGVPTYHIDALFDFEASSTYRALDCSECLRGRCGSQSQCEIGMSYQEGSSWSAFEVQDNCYVGGLHDTAVVQDDYKQDDLDPFHAPAFRFPLKFGCQTKLTGLFKTQLADGIMGMDNADTAFWAQMADGPVNIDRKFSLCYSRSPMAEREGTGAGAMTLGGYDERLHDSDMVHADISEGQGFYTVHVRKVYLRTGGGESALSNSPNAKVVQLNVAESDLNRGNVIVDSGTTDTYYNNLIAREFKNVWKSLISVEYSHSSLTITDEELLEYPTILIQVQGNENLNKLIAQSKGGPVVGLAGELDSDHPYDVILAIPASHYFEYDDQDRKYTNRFYVDEGGGTVLGANAIMGHDLFFDVDGGTIGFAESSCDYQALVQPYIDAGPTDNGDSRQSGQEDDNTGTDDGLPAEIGDDDGEGTDDGTDGNAEQTDDGGEEQTQPSTNGGSSSQSVAGQGDLCGQYTCQSLFMLIGAILAVSVLVTTIVLRRRRRGPRYSEATMSELELRVTSSVDSDEEQFSSSYRDLKGREIT